MYNSLGSDHVQINLITTASETQMKQEFGMADIIELDQDKGSSQTSTLSRPQKFEHTRRNKQIIHRG